MALKDSNLLKNGFYNTVSGIIRIGVGILTIPALIRILGIEEYGLWTLVSAVIGMLTLAEAGLSVSTTVFAAQDIGKGDGEGLSQTLTITFGSMLLLATVAAVITYFLSEFIVSYFPKISESQQQSYTNSLQIGGLVVWTRLLQQVLVGIEQAHQRYDLVNILHTIHSLFVNLGIIVIAWFGGLTVQLMQWQAAMSLTILLSHICIVWLLTRKLNLHISWNNKKAFFVARYSLLNWFTSIGTALFSRADRLILGSVLGAQATGIYSAICSTTGQINLLSALPVQPIIPYLNNILSGDNLKEASEVKKYIKNLFKINIFLSLGLGALFVSISPLITRFLFPDTGNEYIYVFCIASVIYGLYASNAVGYYILLSTDKVSSCLVIVGLSGILSLIMIYIGASNFGLLGAIIGNSGYLLTLLLISLGMNQLAIRQDEWLKWLKFPLICFFFIIIINIMIFQYFL